MQTFLSAMDESLDVSPLSGGYTVLSPGTKLHTFVSGCVPGAVSGPHTLDETYVGLLTGDMDQSCTS